MTVSALLAVGVAGFAGWFALEGRITIGELITVVGLSQFFIEPLGVLAGLPGFLALPARRRTASPWSWTRNRCCPPDRTARSTAASSA